MKTSSTRRSALKRCGGLIGCLIAGLLTSDPVIGSRYEESIGDTGSYETAASWTRLYQGTAAVTVTYLTGLNRVASGEFAVDIRFIGSERLETTAPPFAFMIETGVLLNGNFVSRESPNPYLPSEPIIEGETSVESDFGSGVTDLRGLRDTAWDITYDTQSGEVQGTLVNPSEYGPNYILALEEGVLGDYFPSMKPMGIQSTLAGNIAEEDLSLLFNIIDVDLTIEATVEVTADRRA